MTTTALLAGVPQRRQRDKPGRQANPSDPATLSQL